MGPLFLQSEAQLYDYLKKFLAARPNAFQLDGSVVYRPNSRVMVVFKYSVDGLQYKLSGDVTRKSAETFMKLVEEHGEPGVVFKEYSDSNGKALILANAQAPDGWNCRHFVEKASTRLKKAA